MISSHRAYGADTYGLPYSEFKYSPQASTHWCLDCSNSHPEIFHKQLTNIQ